MLSSSRRPRPHNGAFLRPSLSHLAVLVVLLIVFGCQDEVLSPNPNDSQLASTVEVEPASVTLAPGDTVDMEATPVDEQGNAVLDYEVSWNSEDTTIATVEEDGTVIAQAGGTTAITTTAEKEGAPPLSEKSDVSVDPNALIEALEPSAYEPDTLTSGIEAYVDRQFTIEKVPSHFDGWTYVRTANDDKSVDETDAVSFTLTKEATVAIAYDERASSHPDWLSEWSSVDAMLQTTDADHDIFTRVLGPGDVTLGGNLSGGAEGAESMYVLFASASESPPDEDPQTGSVTVGASTTGDDPDTDGYTVTIAGSTSKDVGPDGSITFSSLDTGSHQVELTGLQSNCTVEGSNPKTVSVTADNTVETSFSVRCPSATGSLEVSTSTSGAEQDSDGYTVTANGHEKTVGPNDTVTFSDLPVGDHEVELSGIQANCSVGESNPRTISIEDSETSSVSFGVTCSTTTGALDVSIATSGDDQDADGYTVTVDGDATEEVGPNGSVTFSDLSEGNHQVDLSGIKSNCSVDGSNPLTVAVDAGNTASAAFDIGCEAVSGPTIESATINNAGNQITLAFDQAVALGPNHEDAHLNPIDDTPSDDPTMAYASGDGTSSLVFDLSRTFLKGETPSIHYDQPGDGIQASDSGADVSTFNDFAVTNTSTQGEALQVSASTSGEDQDPDGYTVTVDGDASKEIGPNGTVTFSDLGAGDHQVELTGIAENCSVDGSNPRTVTVEPGNNASTNVNVSCSATTGSLEVSASTTGDNQDPDGYTVTVDGDASKEIGPNGTVSFSDLGAGDHQVELTGIAENCSVDGSNPRIVSVDPGTSVSETVNVSCSATTGSLDVSASTSGDNQDSNGYTVTVDGDATKEIGPNGSATFTDLSDGDHQVELSGIQSNCSVDGQNPRTVSVEGGNTASTSYTVTCTSTTGSLEVSASTSGDDQDPDGYTVTVDGSTSKDIGPNGTAAFSDLDEGDHQIELSGIKSNCSVEGQNPRTVSVTGGNTASTSYSVSCTATTGSLEVSASTFGDDQDTDGYTVTIDGSTSKDIGPNGSATFSDLSDGNHQVELSGLQSNCSVDGQNPRTVYVEAGGTISASFDVSCTSSGLQDVAIPNQSDFTDQGVVLNPGSCGNWDWWLQGPAAAIKHDGTLYLYYTAMDGDRQGGACDDSNGDERNRHTGVATSTDNRSFSKASSNPQITHQPNADQPYTTGEGGTLQGGSPGVVDGTFVLYVGGLEEFETEQVDSDIVYYESTDGISFSGKTDVGDHSALAAYDDENFPTGAVEIDGSYYVYYTGAGGGDTNSSLQAINGSAPDADMSASSQKVSGPGSNNVKGKSGGAIRKSEDTVMITTQPCFGACETKVWTASTSDPASFTHQETWDWGSNVSEPHLFLDRDAGEWLLFYRYMPDGGSTANNEIHLKTAPVEHEN